MKLLILLAVPMCFAQQRTVPFVGCPANWQGEQEPAPPNGTISLSVSARAAQKLAYYSTSKAGGGVLAPRGWKCLSTWGSGGGSLIVSPQSITYPPGPLPKLAGPAVIVREANGQGSGTMETAPVIARVFPAFREYAKKAEQDLYFFDGVYSPYPADSLKYRSDRIVEFRTPPQTDGLGTQLSLVKGALAVHGIAIVVGNIDYLIQVQVRLPREFENLAPEIIAQAEREPRGH